MKNLLIHNNENVIKTNSADFYTIMIYSKYIKKYDSFRLDDYKNFKSENNKKSDFFDYLKFNKIKLLTSIFISFSLMYKFKSILIIPIFFVSYSVTKKLLLAVETPCRCYFCQCNLVKEDEKKKFEKYYQLIEYIFEKNPNIFNIQDYQNELKLISMKIKY